MVQLTFFFVALEKKMNAWRARILDDERRIGARDLEARRTFNRALVGGRVALKRSKLKAQDDRRKKKAPTAGKKGSSGVAVKNDPKLWAKAKEKACSEGACASTRRGRCSGPSTTTSRTVGRTPGKSRRRTSCTSGPSKSKDAARQKVGGQTSVPSGGSLEAPDQEADQGDEPAEAERYVKGKQWVKQPKDVARVSQQAPPIAEVTKKKRSFFDPYKTRCPLGISHGDVHLLYHIHFFVAQLDFVNLVVCVTFFGAIAVNASSIFIHAPFSYLNEEAAVTLAQLELLVCA